MSGASPEAWCCARSCMWWSHFAGMSGASPEAKLGKASCSPRHGCRVRPACERAWLHQHHHHAALQYWVLVPCSGRVWMWKNGLLTPTCWSAGQHVHMRITCMLAAGLLCPRRLRPARTASRCTRPVCMPASALGPRAGWRGRSPRAGGRHGRTSECLWAGTLISPRTRRPPSWGRPCRAGSPGAGPHAPA
jgi:hypothetical protein